MTMRVAAFVVFVAASALAQSPVIGSLESPVIGIIAQPVPNQAAQYIAASYVKFVEMGGGRGVPLSYLSSNATSRNMFAQLNGVLLPGGGAALPDVARAAVAYSLEARTRGEVFPVWGTCLGFEWMMEAVGGATIVTSGFNAENLSLPLTLTPAAETSTMYGGATNRALRARLQDEALALNNHQRGVSPAALAENEALNSTFDVLSTNVDRDGNHFVSSVEAKDEHLYAVQWHPEKNAFETGETPSGQPFEAINHSPHAVAATFALASTFVDVARRSTQTFHAASDRQARLFYHCTPSPLTYPAFVTSYLFPGNWTGLDPACPAGLQVR